MDVRLEDATTMLAQMPARLSGLLAWHGEIWLASDTGRDTFTPRDVLAHLIDGEKTDWVPRIRIILEEGPRRPFEPFDRFAFRDWIEGRTITQLLGEFKALRLGNLKTLKSWNLSGGDLSREGTHPELGRVTLGQLIAAWVVHDLDHVAQIARAMAWLYRDEVGPWRAYLPVLEARA